MNVYELCQRHVVTVRRHELLATAAWMMRERNVGCLVVVEPAAAGGEKPIGMLTDRDIVTNAIARDSDPRGLLVEDVMNRHPLMVWASATLDEALQRMRSGGVRRVPVIDERGLLVGILALDDIFEHMAQCVPFAATPIRREARLDYAMQP